MFSIVRKEVEFKSLGQHFHHSVEIPCRDNQLFTLKVILFKVLRAVGQQIILQLSRRCSLDLLHVLLISKNPGQISVYIFLGASFFKWIHAGEEEPDYIDCMKKAFRQYPIELAACAELRDPSKCINI